MNVHAKGPDQPKLKQIKAALENPLTLQAHATNWFKKYDLNEDGCLDFEELKRLCAKLNADLEIPSVDDQTIQQCMKKFDTDMDGMLNLDEFTRFYQILLCKVRDHYGGFKIRREFFLDKKGGKPSDTYKLVKTLGQGSFGIAQLVMDKKTKQPRVLKTINKAKANMPPEELEQEIKNMKKLDHPHIIKLFEYYEDYMNVYIVMEAASGGELLKVIEDNYMKGRRLSERWIATVYRQVVEAIAYCHARGVMHKDIKAENIMLLNTVQGASVDKNGNPVMANVNISTADEPHAVLIDFGLAEMFTNTNQRSKICSGTPYTMAPEVWLAGKGVGTIGFKCDIYSLGCVLFHQLCGDFPIMAQTSEPDDWLQLIKVGPNWNKLKGCSPQAVDICKKMMAFDEKSRPSAQEVLNHAWFKLAPERQTYHLNDNQMKSLCDYSKASSFKKAVLLQVATNLRAIEVPKINEIFDSLDADNCGLVRREECVKGLMRLGVPAKIATETTNALDIDGDGKVDYSELVAGVLLNFIDHLDTQLWKVFTSLDTDGSGYLELHEIRTLLKQGELHSLGLVPPEADVEKILKALDTDGNGVVSFDEFKDRKSVV